MDKIVLLPEEKLPPESQIYRQCEICTQNSPIIWGEGNPNGSIMIILDNPGARKDKEGNNFVCGVRRTLQLAIRKAQISINDIYVTFLLKCRPRRKYNKPEVRTFSKPFLIEQIQNKQPKFLVCLGDVVLQTLLNDNQLHIKEYRGRWHQIFNLPTMVSYHPLAVIRRPNLLTYFEKDWLMLAQKYKRTIPN